MNKISRILIKTEFTCVRQVKHSLSELWEPYVEMIEPHYGSE